MSVLNQNLPDGLVSEFYEIARKKFGDKKGCKRSALIEAIGEWVRREKNQH